MKFTEDNALKFYHYATSLIDAMRGILNTKKFDEVNEEYWIKSLSEFKIIISEILDDHYELIPVSNEFIKDAHFRIFGNILNAEIQLYPNENKSELIVRCNQLAKICLKVLYGIEL